MLRIVNDDCIVVRMELFVKQLAADSLVYAHYIIQEPFAKYVITCFNKVINLLLIICILKTQIYVRQILV